jgi:hypothetical protein
MTEFRDVRQDAPLTALEKQMAAILNHLRIDDPVPPAPPGVSNEVAELARSGRTMEAIRAHMAATGADMRTARDEIAAVAQTP